VIPADQHWKSLSIKYGLDAGGDLAPVDLKIVVGDVDVAAVDHAQSFKEPLALVHVPIATRTVSTPSRVADGIVADLTGTEAGARPEADAAVVRDAEEGDIRFDL
jgi:hypothetical protein